MKYQVYYETRTSSHLLLSPKPFDSEDDAKEFIKNLPSAEKRKYSWVKQVEV